VSTELGGTACDKILTAMPRVNL
jgi:hypothetical protein